nr:MAG TPA: hypothetical protein [Caudoviricetes sp.]
MTLIEKKGERGSSGKIFLSCRRAKLDLLGLIIENSYCLQKIHREFMHRL